MLGDGLTVLINCEATGADNFLAFASWYSLRMNLPDADGVIACRRPDEVTMDVFPWVYRLNLPFFYYRKSLPISETGKIVLMMSPDVLCLSPLNDLILRAVNSGDHFFDVANFCLSAKNPSHAVFCSVSEGCGAFVPAKWIDKGGHPFGKADFYSKGYLTVNEKKVFSIWKRLCPLFDNVA